MSLRVRIRHVGYVVEHLDPVNVYQVDRRLLTTMYHCYANMHTYVASTLT
jgi:hypothetical protein